MIKALGIDYGTKYIGLAMGIGEVTAPLKILENKFGHTLGDLAIKEISKIIKEEKIRVVVVGLPMLKGEKTEAVRDIKVFVHKLKKVIPTNIEFIYVDEFYTSKIATQKAVKFEIKKKNRKDDHAIAACEILKRGLGLS